MRRTYQPLPLSPAALARIARAAESLSGSTLRTDKLAEAVSALSRVYTRDRDHMKALPSDQQALLARAGFFFARDLPKLFGPLDELRALGRLPSARRLRVLDLGAGLGATTLGLARWSKLRGRETERIDVVAIEQSASALKGFRLLARSLSELASEFVPVELEARTEDLHLASVEGRFDLVLCGFVLNELFRELPESARAEQRAALVTRLAGQLREGGALIILEPALRDTARELMLLRDRLVEARRAPFVIAPCLHDLGCPMLPSPRDWCHQELSYALPPALAEVAQLASLRYEGLSYASLVLQNQPRPSATGEQLVRIVSDRLESKGKLELFGCSERGYTRHTRLDRDASEHNEPFGSATRGDVLALQGELPARIGKAQRVDKR